MLAESHKKRRYVAVSMVSAGVVIVLAVGGYFAWRILTAPTATSAVKQTDALDETRQYGAARTQLEAALKRASSSSDKALILSRLAATSMDMGDNEVALSYYQQLDKVQPNTYLTLVAIGDLADRLGHKQIALNAYSHALAIRKAEPRALYAQGEIDELTADVARLSK